MSWRRHRPARSAAAGFLVVTLVAVALVATAAPGLSAPPVTVANTCGVSGPAVEGGSVLISHPMVPQITGASLAIDVPVTMAVTSAVNPGGLVGATADVQLDLDAIAQDVLVNRVRPGVVAAGYPALAPSAWVELDLTGVEVAFPLPAGVVPQGDPSAGSSAGSALGAWVPGAVQLRLDHLRADTRSPGPATSASLSWTVLDGGAPAPRQLVVGPGALRFTARVDVGLLFYGAPVAGSVTAPWSCTAADPDLVLAATTVTDDPVVTTAVSTSSSSSSVTASSSSTSTTASRPSTTTLGPGACAVNGFDRFGGFEGRTLDATGFFRTERIDGRWWLVDPDGHPFFSQGINHVTFSGTPDKHGATPYLDAVTAKYGTPEAWADAQVQRMGEWGYNTLGAWSDLSRFGSRVPYTVLLGQTGQSFATGEMQDLFDPGWEAGARATAASAAAAYRDDPMLVGYWSDNELHFGPDWRLGHLLDFYLARPASSPGKQALLSFLQARYPTFAAFASDFVTTATDWASLGDPTTVTSWSPVGGEATRAAWTGVVAERYFSVTAAAVRDADPNHLFLGPRFLSQTTGRPVLEAAARHVDVASFNLYELRPELEAPLRNADPTYLPVDGPLAAQAAILDKPILISEWSFRAADSGLPNTWPPLFPTLETQAQRAAAYEQFVASLLATDWVVGQHWFEHADEPPAGRFDGEDSNFGLVDSADRPYGELTAISRTMHDCAYARLLASAPTPSTTPTTLTASSPTSSVPSATGDDARSVGVGVDGRGRPVVVPRFTG